MLGELEVLAEQVLEVPLGPVRIRACEGRCDVVCVVAPAPVEPAEPPLVIGDGGVDRVDGDQDVLLQQLGELGSCPFPVERDDGMPMSSWLRSSLPAAASASEAPESAATMYWRVQITWSAHSRRSASLSDIVSSKTSSAAPMCLPLRQCVQQALLRLGLDLSPLLIELLTLAVAAPPDTSLPWMMAFQTRTGQGLGRISMCNTFPHLLISLASSALR